MIPLDPMLQSAKAAELAAEFLAVDQLLVSSAGIQDNFEQISGKPVLFLDRLKHDITYHKLLELCPVTEMSWKYRRNVNPSFCSTTVLNVVSSMSSSAQGT